MGGLLMLRMMDYEKANKILSLPFDNIQALSPNDRCIRKDLALEKGAVLNSPFNQSTWADNRLLPVEKAIKPMYLIKFNPDNGASSTTIRVAEGVTPVYPNGTPTKDGYTFNGWSPTVVPATQDTEYTAQWVVDTRYYTISFIDPGNDNWTTVSNTVEENKRIPRPNNPTKEGTSTSEYIFEYIFTGWVDSENSSVVYYYGMVATKDTTFVARYNTEFTANNNVKTMDNMGQIVNFGKTLPANLTHFAPDSNINNPHNWWSGPHDGDSTDVCGEDGGISPNAGSTGRRTVTLDGTTYTHYEGDSVVYEYATGAGALNKSNDSVIGSDLVDSWTGYDSNGNAVFQIKSNSPWIKFVVLAYDRIQPIHFSDIRGINQDTTIDNVHLYLMVEYYIADNTRGSARAGSITVTTEGGDCSYIASQWAPNNKYMTEGTVYFYQLGTSYSV